MAKRKYGMTSAKIRRFIKEGRGQGEGPNFKPWLNIHDFPSLGRVHRPFGWKAKRVHHLFSDIEFRHFLLLDWAEEVVDIREQFPLDFDKTLEIARMAGIPYPTDPDSGESIVMTTDLLVVIGTGANRRLYAWALKPAEELNDKRVIEKLEIERRYWAAKGGVQWHISTERELPMNRIRALEWISSSSDLADVQEPHEGYFDELKHRLVSTLRANENSRQKLNTICANLDEEHNAYPGAHLLIAKHLVAHRVFVTNIDRKNLWDVPLHDVCVDAAAFQELVADGASPTAPDQRAA